MSSLSLPIDNVHVPPELPSVGGLSAPNLVVVHTEYAEGQRPEGAIAMHCEAVQKLSSRASPFGTIGSSFHHILSYTGAIKLRNGKYMGQISPTDERYKLLQTIPKMTLKQSGVPFSSPWDMMYIFCVKFTHKDHSMDLIVNEYKSKCRRVTVAYYNDRQGITLRYFRK